MTILFLLWWGRFWCWSRAEWQQVSHCHWVERLTLYLVVGSLLGATDALDISIKSLIPEILPYHPNNHIHDRSSSFGFSRRVGPWTDTQNNKTISTYYLELFCLPQHTPGLLKLTLVFNQTVILNKVEFVLKDMFLWLNISTHHQSDNNEIYL